MTQAQKIALFETVKSNVSLPISEADKPQIIQDLKGVSFAEFETWLNSQTSVETANNGDTKPLVIDASNANALASILASMPKRQQANSKLHVEIYTAVISKIEFLTKEQKLLLLRNDLTEAISKGQETREKIINDEIERVKTSNSDKFGKMYLTDVKTSVKTMVNGVETSTQKQFPSFFIEFSSVNEKFDLKVGQTNRFRNRKVPLTQTSVNNPSIFNAFKRYHNYNVENGLPGLGYDPNLSNEQHVSVGFFYALDSVE